MVSKLMPFIMKKCVYSKMIHRVKKISVISNMKISVNDTVLRIFKMRI